jgi:hypothetical protein
VGTVGSGAGAGALGAGSPTGVTEPGAVTTAQQSEVSVEIPSTAAAVDPTAAPTTAAPAADPASAVETTVAPPVETTPAPADTAAPTTAYPVVAIGDSVMLGAAPALAAVLPPGSYIDAVVGRQFLSAKEILDSLRSQGLLGSTVVIHLGNNGPTNADTFNQLMSSLTDVPKVLFLTVKVERAWEEKVNQVLFDNAPSYPNAKIIYWRDLAEPNRGWFYDDGIHLRPEGAQAYAQIIQANL